jgi:hypothetical protein
MILDTMNRLIEIITSPLKATIATLGGATIGSTPSVVNSIADTSMTNFDRFFQHGVWTFTILVAISALISFTQKQIDRYKSKHKKK